MLREREQSRVQVEESTELIFRALADQWRKDTRFLSATDDMVLHPAYQNIIGMGPDVIPLLLRELQTRPGQWFWALRSIAREDPVQEADVGNIRRMTEAWLNWGREKGYL